MTVSRLLASTAVLALAAAASAQVATNYTFSQTTGTYTAITGGTQLGVTTGTSGAAGLDDVTYAVTLPFAFTYDGGTHTAIGVNTNGWISFGATLPANTYTPLSATTVVPGFVAACGRDLQGGFVFQGTRTLGSDVITAVSSTGPLQVGDLITGTGIPAGTTVVAIGAGTVTMSALATANSTGSAVACAGPWSELRHETLGTAGNQVFVVQWSNFRRFGTGLTTVQDMRLNFQIRLHEANGRIEAVYGDCTPGTTTYATSVHQVGLRGPNNTFATNVNNRLNTKGVNDNWLNSVAGTANSSGMVFNNVAPANVIPNGLTYTWDPPSGVPASHLAYGVGCRSAYASIYQTFANGGAFDLNGVNLEWNETPNGWVISTSSGPSAPSSPTAYVLADDSEVTQALSSGFATSVNVCSNGFISVDGSNGTGFSPSTSGLLNDTFESWRVWCDLNPAAAGSGPVTYEFIGGEDVFTYNGVYRFLGTSAADASTFQISFSGTPGTRKVRICITSMAATIPGAILVGYSPAGASLDPGNTDLSAATLPIALVPDVAALALSASPSPVLGVPVTYTVSNIRPSLSISAIVVSFITSAPTPLSTYGQNAPGCFAHLDLLSSVMFGNLLLGNPTDSYTITMPTHPAWAGAMLYFQAAELSPSDNPAGVITSNGLKSTLGNF